MKTVLPAKLAGVLRVGEPLFSPDQDVNRQRWQKLAAMGISAAEFQTNEIRLWMSDNTRMDYEKAENPSAVARWIAKQNVAVFGPMCPSELRCEVVHANSDAVGFVTVASKAMETKSKLWIRYGGKARDGEVTERVITPIRWSELGLVAHCHMRNEERTFVANRVIEFREVK